MLKETDYIRYIDSLLKGDKKECIKIVDLLLNKGTKVEEIYFGLLQRSMHRMGQLWQKRQTTIVDEGIAADITYNIISLIYPRIASGPKNGLKIFITCIDKEHHSLGARIVSDIFELNGWKSTFAGPCVPCADILVSIKNSKPDVVGISSSFYLNIKRLINLIEEIKSEIPEQEIIIGGQIFNNGGKEIIKKYENVKYISSMRMLKSYIKEKSIPR